MNEITREFEQAFADTGPMLRAYFCRQQALAPNADDLVQETFLRAWKRRDQWRNAVSPRAYLFGIARHVQLDTLRRRRPAEPLDEECPVETVAPPDARLERMRAAIALLSEVHREPLLLKLEHDLSYAEIASVLDLPVGTVRSRLHYAVLQLRAGLLADIPSKTP